MKSKSKPIIDCLQYMYEIANIRHLCFFFCSDANRHLQNNTALNCIFTVLQAKQKLQQHALWPYPA